MTERTVELDYRALSDGRIAITHFDSAEEPLPGIAVSMLRGFVARCRQHSISEIVAIVDNSETNWALFTIAGFEFLSIFPGENRAAYYLVLDNQREIKATETTNETHSHV